MLCSQRGAEAQGEAHETARIHSSVRLRGDLAGGIARVTAKPVIGYLGSETPGVA